MEKIDDILTRGNKKKCFQPYGVTVRENFISNDIINKIHSYVDTIPSVPAAIGNGRNVPEYRKSTVKWVVHNKEIDWLFKLIAKEIETVNNQSSRFQLDAIEPLQYTIYNGDQKDKFSWHSDLIAMPDGLDEYNKPNHCIRKLTAVILLSDRSEFFGGQLFVSPEGGEGEEIPFEKGTVVIFPSWFPHKVTPVIKGCRRTLVVWATGKKFV